MASSALKRELIADVGVGGAVNEPLGLTKCIENPCQDFRYNVDKMSPISNIPHSPCHRSGEILHKNGERKSSLMPSTTQPAKNPETKCASFVFYSLGYVFIVLDHISRLVEDVFRLDEGQPIPVCYAKIF